MRNPILYLLVIATLLISGCVDQRQIDDLQMQIENQKRQISADEVALSELKIKEQDYEQALQRLKEENASLTQQISTLLSENLAYEEQIHTLEMALQHYNETALDAIKRKADYQAKVLSLKETDFLKAMIDTYEDSLEEPAASHYGQCLYSAVKREGVIELVRLLEKENFHKVDGVIGHFATGLKSKEDLTFKTQLMMEAASIDSSQSPTTLYFYARVLYFLSRN